MNSSQEWSLACSFLHCEDIAAVPGNLRNFYAYKDPSPHGPFFNHHGEMFKDSAGGSVHVIPMSQHVYL